MSNVLNANPIGSDRTTFKVTGTITFSGSYVQVANGGEVLNFGSANFPVGSPGLPAQGPPTMVQVNGSRGYSFGVTGLGTGPNGLILRINTADGAELAAGPYPADITADLAIQFEAIFPKFQ